MDRNKIRMDRNEILNGMRSWVRSRVENFRIVDVSRSIIQVKCEMILNFNSFNNNIDSKILTDGSTKNFKII